MHLTWRCQNLLTGCNPYLDLKLCNFQAFNPTMSKFMFWMQSVSRWEILQFSNVTPEYVKICVLYAIHAMIWNFAIFKHLTWRCQNLRFGCIPCHDVKLYNFQSLHLKMWKLHVRSIPCYEVKLCNFHAFNLNMWKFDFWMQSVLWRQSLQFSSI